MAAPYEVNKQQEKLRLPQEFEPFSNNRELVGAVLRLLQVGETAKKAFGTPVYDLHREEFERVLNELLDNEHVGTLLSELHPTLSVNWVGFIRYYIGEAVGGKREILPRQVRGVSDKSGKK